MKFSELPLNDSVLDALDAMRFEECTPIQEKSIPVILEGRDLIAVAQTGTGKTAAYLLPVLNRLSEEEHPEDAINCIVMAPTRELAQQIDQQMEGFSYFMPVSSVAVYGGNDGILFEQQKKGLTLGADVVIATPGRLIAHLNLGYVDLSKVSYFILDEADRMLDMGFYDDIMQIVKYLPKERQTIMFSATMPAKIQQLAKNILNNPAEVKLAVSKPADKIIQAAYVCYENQKLGIIRSLFAEEVPERVIIFASSKIKVKEVTKALKQMKLNVGEMHSDTAKTMCIASDVLPVPTMTVWPSPSSAKKSRLTSTPSRNSLRGISIRFLFRPNWVKRPNISRATTKKVDENEEEANRAEADEKAQATKEKKRIKNNLCFLSYPINKEIAQGILSRAIFIFRRLCVSSFGNLDCRHKSLLYPDLGKHESAMSFACRACIGKRHKLRSFPRYRA